MVVKNTIFLISLISQAYYGSELNLLPCCVLFRQSSRYTNKIAISSKQEIIEESTNCIKSCDRGGVAFVHQAKGPRLKSRSQAAMNSKNLISFLSFFGSLILLMLRKWAVPLGVDLYFLLSTELS